MSTVLQSLWTSIMGRSVTQAATARRRKASVGRMATVENLESREMLSAAPVDHRVRHIMTDAAPQVVITGQINSGTNNANNNAHMNSRAVPRSLVPFTDADATRGGATNFNAPGTGYTAGGGVQSKSGTLSNDHPDGPFGGDDRIDYYKFTLNQSNGVNVKISGLRADLDLYLEDANGRVINSSTRSGTVDDSLDALLGPGTYYIRIQRFGTTGSTYSLQLTTGQDSLSTAIYLGTNPGSTIGSPFNINQTVGNGDVMDYYKFDVSSRRGVRATLTGLAVDVDLEIQNSSGTVIKRANASGRTNEVLRVNLNAGTYYVRVYRFASSGETSYNLQIAATPGVYSDLP